MKEIILYTDGSFYKGIGAYAAVMLYRDKKYTFTKKFSGTTNNRMEILAAIEPIELLDDRCSITVISDSQYLVRSVSEKWMYSWEKKNFEGKKNPDLFKRLLKLDRFHNLKFKWVKGHAGDKFNNECDKICGDTRQRKQERVFEDKR